MGPVLESEGDNWNPGSELDELMKDDADEGPNLKDRIEEAEKLILHMSQDKFKLTQEVAQRTHDRNCTISRLEYLKRQTNELGNCLTLEREKMNILQLFLDELCSANNADHGKPIKPCLSGQTIAKRKLNFRMVHGTNSLAEEKQLLKEINLSQKDNFGSFPSLRIIFAYIHTGNPWRWHRPRQHWINQMETVERRLSEIQELRWRRATSVTLLQRQFDEAIAHANENARAAANVIAQGKIWDSLGSRKGLRDQIKKSGKQFDELTKLLLAVRPQIKHAEKVLAVIEKDLETLKKKLPLTDERKNEAHQCILQLIKQQSYEVYSYVPMTQHEHEVK